MNYAHITIVPAAGHSDDKGLFDLGRIGQRTNEVSVVDQYARTFIETLEEYAIPYDIMNTRRYPGVKESKRHSLLKINSIVIELAVGWFDNDSRTRNRSEVYYYNHEAKLISDRISETLAEWGRCTNYQHIAGGAKKIKRPLLCVTGTAGIRVEPFALNGPKSDDYMKRLSNLGEDLGLSVVDFIKSKNPMVGYRPYTVPTHSESAVSHTPDFQILRK